MNEEIHTVKKKKKGKTATNEWENDGSDIIGVLYIVYKKYCNSFLILTR